MSGPVVIAVSSCLLGERVRYDGGHKRQGDLLAWWGERVRWVPMCPEVMAGLPVPRPSIHLVRGVAGLRVVDVEGTSDHTESIRVAAQRVVAAMRAEGACGLVAKARSPSCGVGDAGVFDADRQPNGEADGRAVAAVRAAWPDLPIASEETLATRAAADAFLARARAYAAKRPCRQEAMPPRGHVTKR